MASESVEGPLDFLGVLGKLIDSIDLNLLSVLGVGGPFLSLLFLEGEGGAEEELDLEDEVSSDDLPEDAEVERSLVPLKF